MVKLKVGQSQSTLRGENWVYEQTEQGSACSLGGKGEGTAFGDKKRR